MSTKSTFLQICALLLLLLSIECQLLTELNEAGTAAANVLGEERVLIANQSSDQMTTESANYKTSSEAEGKETDGAGDEETLLPRMIAHRQPSTSPTYSPRRVPSSLSTLLTSASNGALSKVTSLGSSLSDSPGILPSDSFNVQCLKMHNFLRKKHGVPSLQLDDGMAASAQRWAEHLFRQRPSKDFEPRSDNGKRNMGQNLFRLRSEHLTVTGEEVTKAWYAEQKFYTFGSDPEDPKIREKVQTFAHFTQLVWKETQWIGCGLASHSNTWIAVCDYYPAGNIPGAFKSNVLPLPPYNRFVDPLKDTLGRSVNRALGRKESQNAEAFRQLREGLFYSGDASMSGIQISSVKSGGLNSFSLT